MSWGMMGDQVVKRGVKLQVIITGGLSHNSGLELRSKGYEIKKQKLSKIWQLTVGWQLETF